MDQAATPPCILQEPYNLWLFCLITCGSFAENDQQLKACYGAWPLCSATRNVCVCVCVCVGVCDVCVCVCE